MQFGFLIDPPGTLHIKKDTSFALMLEAQAQGHSVWLLERGDLSLQSGKLYANARQAHVADDASHPFDLGAHKRMPADQLDVLFVRTDPPFNTDYLTDTWLLSHAGKRPVVLNSPEGLRNINEKIWAARFADLTPATLITADKAEFLSFLQRFQRVVIKPTDGFGGSAVFLLQAGEKNAAVTFETLSRMNRYVIVQEYLTEATEGDKRILLLEGEILGAVLRLHSGDDHRNNFAAGGKPGKTAITEAERKICDRLKPFLLENGIFFAGIDVIGEKLIEVNVTSPTCLREMQQYYSENLAARIIGAAVKLAEKEHARN
ncbi:MAG: glutathione synthase [Spirochaetota bacterium]